MQYSSPHFDGRHFQNPVPTEVNSKGSFWKIMKEFFKKHPHRFPEKTPGPFPVTSLPSTSSSNNSLKVTWLGHSTTLVELEGKFFLTDPVWYQRASPFTLLGPKRFFDVPLALHELPPITSILLSHDHYDHLDKHTLLYLTEKNIPVLTMLGVGKRLAKWGVNKNLITELDWWHSYPVDKNIVVTACPARHFSGRTLNDRFSTLWGSFAIKGQRQSVYFGADSGMYPGFGTIGERLGPFDLTMLDTGAYNPYWASIHMGPENAVQAHKDLKGNLLMPIHWGTFALAFHPWTEPVERVIKAANQQHIPLLLPAPGQTCCIENGAYNSEWWKKAV